MLLSSCAYDSLTLEQLSNDQLLTKQAKIRRVGFGILLLLVLLVGMAFVVESYFVAVSSWALLPALADYSKKRKAIQCQLQKRRIV